MGPWWYCVAPLAAGQVVSQHWQNGNWQSPTDICVRFATSSTFYHSGGTPGSTARSQGWTEWKGENIHHVAVLHRMQLMWWRLGCNFNHSPCCLKIHACHPSPVCHLFCIPEDLSWALPLVWLHLWLFPYISVGILLSWKFTWSPGVSPSQIGRQNTWGIAGKNTTEAEWTGRPPLPNQGRLREQVSMGQKEGTC